MNHITFKVNQMPISDKEKKTIQTLIENVNKHLEDFVTEARELKNDLGIDVTATEGFKTKYRILTAFAGETAQQAAEATTKASSKLTKEQTNNLFAAMKQKVKDSGKDGIHTSEFKSWFVTEHPNFANKYNSLLQKLKDTNKTGVSYRIKTEGSPKDGGYLSYK